MVQPKGPKAPGNRETGHDDAMSKREQFAPKAAQGDVGTALRNAFRATVEEDIPAEMPKKTKKLKNKLLT